MAQQRLVGATEAAEAESGGGLLSTISSVASAAVPGLGAISSMFSKD